MELLKGEDREKEGSKERKRGELPENESCRVKVRTRGTAENELSRMSAW